MVPGVPTIQNGRGGTDYRFAPQRPYYPDYADVTREGCARIVEVPVTVGFTRPVPSWVRQYYGALPLLGQRLLRRPGILRPVWASPAEQSQSQLDSMVRTALAEHPPLFNMAFHSSELMVGGSPKSRTAEEVEEILRRIEGVLEHLVSSRACTFATLTEAAEHWKTRHPARVVAACSEPQSDRGHSLRSVGSARRPGGASSGRVTIAYILAASHSGSTLLAMLLGAHPETCTAGELTLAHLGNVDQYRCSCGEMIRQCSFWSRVTESMADRGFPVDIANASTDVRHSGTWYTNALLRPLHRGAILEGVRDVALGFSPTWRRTLPMIQQKTAALAESICETYGRRTIVDSSKGALRLKYLLRNPAFDVKVVRLVRDGRGVSLTYMRPGDYADATDPNLRGGGLGTAEGDEGLGAREAAHEWRRSNEEAEKLLAGLDRSQWAQVRYEALCTEPDETLRGLFEFLGVDPSRMVRDFRSTDQHVVGNGMRLDSTNEIRLDDRWKSVLTPNELRVFDVVAGDMNRRYGYT